jgi:hypothetical protein
MVSEISLPGLRGHKYGLYKWGQLSLIGNKSTEPTCNLIKCSFDLSRRLNCPDSVQTRDTLIRAENKNGYKVTIS